MTQAAVTAHVVERPRALTVWTEPNNIELFTIAGIVLHLFLRYLLNSPRIAWQVPLIAVLIIGGIPLLVRLTQKLFAREFGSDHLAGISIITSVTLGEYLVAAIVILMLSGGTALEHSNLDIELVTAMERKELKPRELACRDERPALLLKGRTVIVVNDGLATGASMRASLTALRQLAPAHIVVAAPVAPLSAYSLLKSEVDELVCLYAPQSFRGIGQFYEDFSQVSDAEVIELLKRAKAPVLQSAA